MVDASSSGNVGLSWRRVLTDMSTSNTAAERRGAEGG